MKIRTAPRELYLGLFDIFSSKKEISGRFLLFDGKIRTYFIAKFIRSVFVNSAMPPPHPTKNHPNKKDKSESSRFRYPFGLSAIYRRSQSVTSPVTHRYYSKKCWILSKGMISFRSYRSVWTAPGMIISSLFSPFKSLNVSRLR